MYFMEKLKANVINIFGDSGKAWLDNLAPITSELARYWALKHISPIDNMTFNYVAKAITDQNQPVVLKICCDKEIYKGEKSALEYFNGYACIKLLGSHEGCNALLLQQAIPGLTLESLYTSQEKAVMDCYTSTMLKLHNKGLAPHHNFPHIREWLTAIDYLRSDQLPHNILQNAKYLKENLLSSIRSEIILHGDLHLDNILKDGDGWLCIDPKGVIGEQEFEIAAFNFIRNIELENKANIKELFDRRINYLARKSKLSAERIKHWVFVRLILMAAWQIEGNSDPGWAINLAKILS